MANAVVRIFDNEQTARDAAGKLIEDGFPQGDIYVVTPAASGEEVGGPGPDAFAGAIKAGQLMGDTAPIYADRVRSGRSLVVVPAAFGYARRAAEIMESCGPVDTDIEIPTDPYDWNVGTPFSSAVCVPVLTRNRPAPLSGAIGLTPLLGNGTATFGTLASSKFFPSSFFTLLIKRAAPLSSTFGLKLLLAPKRSWNSSFGLPLLSRKAAPLSSSFGLPTSSRNAAPLSSLLRFPTLVPEAR